jgi:hypothetical protein
MRKSINPLRVLLTMSACFILATALQAQVGKNLIINNFLSDPENVETHFVISDVDGVGPNIKISIFSEDGRLVYERYETLNAYGKLNYNPFIHLNAYQHGFNQNPRFRGTVRIESDGANVIGQYWEFYKKTEMNYKNIAVPAADGIGYDKLVCQHFVSDKGINSAMIVANAESKRPVTVNVKFYSDQGGLVASSKEIIQPNGIIRLNPYKVTRGLVMTGTAYVTVVGAGKVTGEYWQGSEKEKYQVALPLEGVTNVR